MADSQACSGEIVPRLARESDFQAILEISEGLYDGEDYLPNVFFQWLNDANRNIIIAEMESKVIGLNVLHVVDAGKTIVHQALRIHPRYRGQNLGTKFFQRIEQYIREHFPTVDIERLVTVSYSPKVQSIAKRFSFEPFLSFNVCELPIQWDTFLTSEETFLTSEVVKFMTKDEFESLIVQSTCKLNGVIAKNIFVIHHHPYNVLPSNCSNGLLETQDCFYVHTNSDTKAIQSLSHGRMVPKVKNMNWMATIYTSDAELLRIHIAKQLKSAILQSKGKSFSFCCYFYQILTLNLSAKLFFQNELLMEENEIKLMDMIVYQKFVNK